jgi:serine O-acetyltransferase
VLIEAVNKMFGGTWVIKEHYLASNSRSLKRLLNLVYTRALQTKGSWISIDARFASIPCFPHGVYGIFISGGVEVGKNCVIFQQVTIGSNTLIDSANLGAPKIGDSCYIGAGAKIIGKVTLGNNVRVGANAVVVSDVPDNSIVTSGEQRVIPRDYPLNNRFYHKYMGQWFYIDAGVSRVVTDMQELELLRSRFAARRNAETKIPEGQP